MRKRVSDFLGKGRSNAVPKEAVMDLFGVSERSVRQMVATERMGGTPILTDTASGGYYLPGSHDETERFVRSMRSRGVRILRVADEVERTMLEDIGQMELDGWDENSLGGG